MGSKPITTRSRVTLRRSSPELEGEPQAELQAASVSSQTGHSLSRSCYGCNRRKVRCDKKDPCSPCARAGKACDYPPLGPRTRRSKAAIMADMASRISSLEKSLSEAREFESASATPSTTTVPICETSATHSPQLSSIANSSELNERSRQDILVQNGSSSQYFNEILLSRVIEDERKFESVLTTHQTKTPNQPISSPFNALGIISAPSLSIVPSSLHPPKQLAMRLWTAYVDNVEGCTWLKLLHLPTDEIKVYSVIADPTAAPLEDLALNFAIYFAAVVSLDSPEASGALGRDKNALLLQLKVGLEQAFAHGDFLDCPNVAGLRALAVYLSALRVYNRGKGIWILNGLAIRIAQSLGLHRDGEQLGLSPFQSEIRRRLWWQLLSRDGRAGEDYGLENANSLLLVSDVKLPRNIDDTDIDPDTERLPEAKKGWTAMTFSLVNLELTKCTQKLAAIVSSTPSSPPSEEVRAQIIDETKAYVEKWLVQCNPVVPQQRLTLHCSRFLLRKLEFTTKLQWILLRHSGPRADFATEENLTEALEILEPRFRVDDCLLDQFSWAKKAYPQYHTLMYVLWHLCIKPEGPNVDRAWVAIEALFSLEILDGSTLGFASKSAILSALKEKALSVRERTRQRNSGDILGVNTLDTNPAPGKDSPRADKNLSGYFHGDTSSTEPDIDHGMTDWPSWETLVQGFQVDGPGMFWQ